MSDDWYFANERGHVGPFSLQQLKQTLSTMEDPADVLVWCNKFTDWKSVRDVTELWAEFEAHSSATVILETKDKSRFLRNPQWLLFIFALPLLGSVVYRSGLEKMRRFSGDLRISREIKRWLNEDPPDVIVSIARVIKANLPFVLVSAACLVYGVYDGLLLNSPVSGLIVGILSAGIVNLAILTVRKYRVKKPTPLLTRIGTIAYCLGWALAAYGVFLMVHQIFHAGLTGGLRAAGGLLPSVIFYPAAGWCVRYMLGRQVT
jgi:hypothetical protein